MFATFDRSGVSFAYPENWLLEEESDDDAKLNLTLSSPNTAFWTLFVYEEAIDLDHVLNQAVEALRGEYPDLETSSAAEKIAECELNGIDVNFICLDLTSTTRLRACHHRGSTYLILRQAEDRELDQVEPVFNAIMQSLLSESDASVSSQVLPE